MLSVAATNDMHIYVIFPTTSLLQSGIFFSADFPEWYMSCRNHTFCFNHSKNAVLGKKFIVSYRVNFIALYSHFSYRTTRSYCSEEPCFVTV
jgi:hypothetical protein